MAQFVVLMVGTQAQCDRISDLAGVRIRTGRRYDGIEIVSIRDL